MEKRRFGPSGRVLIPVLLLQAILWGCAGLRSEFYREETTHCYKAACQLYKQGDYRTARSGFAHVIALDPNYGPAHAALGNLALIGEDYPGALTRYRAAVNANPELAADLQSLIMVANAHMERRPLRKAGISLDRLYPLIMAGRMHAIEALLEKDIPLHLLANDTMGITPGRLGEMRAKIAATADPLKGSPRYRLFLGYMLFGSQIDDALAADLLKSTVRQSPPKDQQRAFVVLGQLYERQSQLNPAVDAYLAALDAGLPVTSVAHHLARLYRVDTDRILGPEAVPTGVGALPVSMQFDMSASVPVLRTVDRVNLSLP
jgi:tetratricopeptide (TPR) repeat protein